MTKEEYQQELEELNTQLTQSEIVSDHQRLAEVSKRQAEVSHIVRLMNEIDDLEQQHKESQEMSKDQDEDLQDLAQEELAVLEPQIQQKKQDLQNILYPPEEIPQEIIVEIRAGAGGDEAGLFAAEMWKAYWNYLEEKGMKTSTLSISDNDVGGIKEVVFEGKGKDIYNYLRYESGVHRVQRVPTTEKSGRVHTSTITVAVLPVAKEVDIEIKPNEIKMDTFRSSGPGGQSVNTTDSAVRLTHLPTDTVVSCQDEKSQLKNREKAMKILRSKILESQRQEAEAQAANERNNQIGSGDRSEKIRTYNFPQDRITDHRIQHNFSNIEKVMLGEFDRIVNALHDFYTTPPQD